jgi:hypothetical protein
MKVEVVNDRGELEYLEADVHAALVAVGLVWREGDRWRKARSTDVGEFPELAICDFCNGRPAVLEAVVDDFTLYGRSVNGITTFESVNNWLMCAACGAYVAAGDRAALLARALAKYGDRPAPVLASLVELHGQFWRGYRSIRRYATPYAAGKADT